MKISIICTSNDKECGIGNFSNDLCTHIKENYPHNEIIITSNIEEVINFKPDIVNFQFEYGLFETQTLIHYLNVLKRRNVPKTITMHGLSEYDKKTSIIETSFDAIIVTNENFKNRLIERNIKTPIHVIPLATGESSYNSNQNTYKDNLKETTYEDNLSQTTYENNSSTKNKESTKELIGLRNDGYTIGAFGFLEQYKNFHMIYDALLTIKQTTPSFPPITFLLCSYSKRQDDKYTQELQNTSYYFAKNHNIQTIHLTQYMSIENVIKVLSLCDLLIYPYIDVFTYSSSAAIRTGITSNVPIIANDITFFSDIPDMNTSPNGCVYKIKSFQDLPETIKKVLTDKIIRETLKQNSKIFIDQNNWNIITQKYIDTFNNYVQQKM